MPMSPYHYVKSTAHSVIEPRAVSMAAFWPKTDPRRQTPKAMASMAATQPVPKAPKVALPG